MKEKEKGDGMKWDGKEDRFVQLLFT